MTSAPRRHHVNAGAAVLWASAFIIAALVIVQAGRMQPNAAHADMVNSRADYTLMTASSGRGGDADPVELLYVIDSRDSVLMVYDFEDIRRKEMILRYGYPLDRLFAEAR